MRKKVHGWLRARLLRDLFSATVEQRDRPPTLAHAFKAEAWERLPTTQFSKTLLFTDNHA